MVVKDTMKKNQKETVKSRTSVTSDQFSLHLIENDLYYKAPREFNINYYIICTILLALY